MFADCDIEAGVDSAFGAIVETAGQICSAAQLHKVAALVERARQRSANVRCGGHPAANPPTGEGWFFEPTILDDLAPNDECVQQEIFGPAPSLQVFDTPDEAIALANGTPFALVAGVFTRDWSTGLADRDLGLP